MRLVESLKLKFKFIYKRLEILIWDIDFWVLKNVSWKHKPIVVWQYWSAKYLLLINGNKALMFL